MPWFYLILGALMEIVWVYGLSFMEGFKHLGWLAPTLVAVVASFYLFAKALSKMDISTGYAVFTGLGSFGTAVVGMAFLGEPVSVSRVLLLTLLISCIIGLKLVPESEQI